MPVFVDTNVLVYARDASDPHKHAQAHAWMQHLWETDAGRLSVQVLEEYYVTVTRKLKPGLSREEARADIADLTAWHPLPIAEGVLGSAWSIEDRFRLSFWDALVVAAALDTGCAFLLTEDLRDGMDLDGVKVVDPFGTQVGSVV